MTPEETQAVRDEEHLRLLSLFHYVSGGVTILVSSMAAVYMGLMGAAMAASTPPPRADGPPAEQFEVMFVEMVPVFGMMCALVVLYGLVEIVAGRCISRRRARAFTMFAGLPRVMFIPYGALLTAFTMMVLDRRSVQQLYHPAARASVQNADLNPPPE